MKRRLHALVACLFCATVGCATTTPASFTPSGYKHADYELQVAAQPDGQLMSSSWNLDNYYEKTSTSTSPATSPTTTSQPASRSGPEVPENATTTTTTTLLPKKGPEYTAVYFLDLDGDGEADKEWKDPAYALRFTHRETNGVVWLRAFPVSTRTNQKALKTLLQGYVDDISGAGYDVVWVARDTAIVSKEKTYAATIVSGSAGTIAGQEMYEVIVDVANLDQLRLDPNHRYRRLHIVLARTPFTRAISNPTQTEVTNFPVLMLAAHANAPDEFETTAPDFLSLLGRVALAGKTGYVSNLEVNDPPPQSTTAPAPEGSESTEAAAPGGETPSENAVGENSASEPDSTTPASATDDAQPDKADGKASSADP